MRSTQKARLKGLVVGQMNQCKARSVPGSAASVTAELGVGQGDQTANDVFHNAIGCGGARGNANP